MIFLISIRNNIHRQVVHNNLHVLFSQKDEYKRKHNDLENKLNAATQRVSHLWMNEWMIECMGEWVNEWMIEWTNGYDWVREWVSE